MRDKVVDRLLNGLILRNRGEYDRAIERLRKTLELDPVHPRLYYYLGRAFVGKAMFEEAIAALQKGSQLSGGDSRILGVLGYSYGLMGRTSEAQNLLAELEKGSTPGYLSSFSVALIYVGLGETDRAFEWLEKAYEERSSPLRHLKVDPLFDKLRSDPRFTVILRRMGLESSVGLR